MLIISGLLFLLAACATQEEKMMKTGKGVVEAIAGNDYPRFRKMMGRSLREMSLTEERLRSRFNEMHRAMMKYRKDSLPVPVLLDTITPLSTRIVRVPLFEGVDPVEDIRKVYINIHMGPPQIVPLSKVTNISYVVKYGPGNPKSIMNDYEQ
jgi:hypothetical protein